MKFEQFARVDPIKSKFLVYSRVGSWEELTILRAKNSIGDDKRFVAQLGLKAEVSFRLTPVIHFKGDKAPRCSDYVIVFRSKNAKCE